MTAATPRVLKTLMALVDGKPVCVYTNGSQRGLQVRLSPRDAARLLHAIVAPLVA